MRTQHINLGSRQFVQIVWLVYGKFVLQREKSDSYQPGENKLHGDGKFFTVLVFYLKFFSQLLSGKEIFPKRHNFNQANKDNSLLKCCKYTLQIFEKDLSMYQAFLSSALARNLSSKSLRSFFLIFFPVRSYPICSSSLQNFNGTSPIVLRGAT